MIGSLIGDRYLVWSLLVLVDWANGSSISLFWGHIRNRIYVAKPFEPIAAVALIAIRAVIGYAFDSLGAVILNRLHRF